MAEQTKKKTYNPTAFTPKARAVFPRLNTPDTKFNAQGRYSVKIRLPEAEGRDFLATLQKIDEENFKEVVAAHSNDIDKKTGKLLPPPTNDGLPYSLELGDDKKPNGYMTVGFGMTASYTDKKTQKMVALKPALYDSQGKPINVEVGGGSLIKVAFQPSGYYVEGTRKAGVSLRLQAVQIIELVKFGGVTFGKEEGGYVAEENQPFPSDEGSAPSVSSTSAGNF